MKHIHSLVRIILTALLTMICSSTRAQTVAVIGEEGLEFDHIQRLTDGSYVTSHVISGSEVISKFDANMQCIWTKEIQIPGAVTWWPSHTTGTADGNMVVLANSGAETIQGPDPMGMDDSLDVRIDLVRLNPSATPIWSKRMHFVTTLAWFSDYQPLSVKMNDIGESVVVLRSSGGFQSQRMIRISASGEVRWMATFSEYPTVVEGFIPDGSTACYFTCSTQGNSGPLVIGLVDQAGGVQWTKRITYTPNANMNAFYVCVGFDGKLLLAGKQSSNVFLMKMAADGMPEWFRLVTTVPPDDLGVGSALYGIEPTSYGYMVVRNTAYPARTVVQYHALDGSLLTGYSTRTLAEGVVTKSLNFFEIGSVGDEITMSGVYYVRNTLFNQEVGRPCVTTLPSQQPGECFFGSEIFAEMPVALSDLLVEDISVASFLPVPPVSDIAVNVVDLPLTPMSSLCAEVGLEEITSTSPSVIYDPGYALATVRGILPGQLVSLHNAFGQDLGTWRVRSNTIDVSLDNLPSGPVLVTVRDAQGGLLLSQKLIMVR